MTVDAPQTNGVANGETNGAAKTVAKAAAQRAPYGDYQKDIYQKGLRGIKPDITTDPNLLREQAKKVMNVQGYNYIAGGAGEGSTMDANRLAFRQWKIMPRMMRPTAPRDLSIELFGEKHDSPLLMAPVGVQGVYHPDKEVGTAGACADLGVPFIMSTASTSTFEEVTEASGDNAKWFQLYWPMDDDITGSMLRRAKALGFKVLVITLDTATMSWRPYDLDTAFMPMLTAGDNVPGKQDPVFREKFAAKYGGATPEQQPLAASLEWIATAYSGDSHPWEDLELIKKHWDGPIVLKGIQDVEDAKMAVKYGMSGIVVSNHGGRQVDGAVASLDCLPEIVEAVGDKITVLYDSGIRTGADVIKALALGAKGVLVARPVMYGLGIGGREGAKHVLASILADVDATMGLIGVKRISELNKSCLRQASYPGDTKTSS